MSTIAAPRSLTRDPFPARGPIVGTAHAPIPAGHVVRRGLVVLVLLLVAAAAVLLGTQARSVAGDVPSPAVQVVVQPGDTIWELAAEHRPAGITTQEYAMVIVLHNEVDATALLPGSVIELPTSAR